MQQNKYKAIEATGHAGYAQEGEDIVCAAITSAIQLLHIQLDDVMNLGVHTEVDPETTYIGITLPDGLSAKDDLMSQQAMLAIHKHYSEMAKDYAQFIKVMEVKFDA